MLESYFFIPATHPKIAEKLLSISADHIIIDLEDAVKKEDIERSLKLLEQIELHKHTWVRPPLFRNEHFDQKLFRDLLQLGFVNFIIPKFRSIKHLKEIESCWNEKEKENCRFVLVVENPESLINLREILAATGLKISAVGFGSQDYCAETGMLHTSENLKHPRFFISAIAKSFGKKAIDIASMEISDEEVILQEIKEAFELGFEGKFLIHPRQLALLNSYPFYNSEQINEAKEILNSYEHEGKPAVLVFKGKVIEPPHIKQYQKIINWSRNHGKK